MQLEGLVLMTLFFLFSFLIDDDHVMAAHGGAAEGAFKVNSLVLSGDVSPLTGAVVWDKWRSIWNTFIFLSALSLGPVYFTLGAFVVFCL